MTEERLRSNWRGGVRSETRVDILQRQVHFTVSMDTELIRRLENEPGRWQQLKTEVCIHWMRLLEDYYDALERER